MIVLIGVFGIAAAVAMLMGIVSYFAFVTDDLRRAVRRYDRTGESLEYTWRNVYVVAGLKFRVTTSGQGHFNVECKVPFTTWQQLWHREALDLAMNDIEEAAEHFRTWLNKRPAAATVVSKVVEVVPTEE